jgi:hypothetical protein
MKKSFAEELLFSMRDKLDKVDELKESNDLSQILKQLHSASTLLRDVGLNKQSDHVILVMSKIANHPKVLSKLAKKEKKVKKLKVVEVDENYVEDNEDYKNWMQYLNKKSDKEDTSKLDPRLKNILDKSDNSILDLDINDADIKNYEEDSDFED